MNDIEKLQWVARDAASRGDLGVAEICDTAVAEIKHLRAALRGVANMDWKQADTLELAIEIAREALRDE